MLRLFHGSLSDQPDLGPLSFFGHLQTAVERAESLFMNHGNWRMYGDGVFKLVDISTKEIIGSEQPGETLNKFADFMDNVLIGSYDISIEKSLRLVDCWEDDPVGSGAMKIFNERSGLTEQQLESLQNLFYPYNDIIYPHHVQLFSNDGQIKKMLKEGEKDIVFSRELEKRRVRSEKMGIKFEFVSPQEIVWTALTINLMRWAQKQGYDSFVYEGEYEGSNLDSYVVFSDKQISNCALRAQFRKEAFLNDILPDFSSYVRDQEDFGQIDTSVLWGGKNVLDYWELK
ncbi:MAG: hypothetical protein OEY94_10365 [Alphaproteobacteria bacterium]|nr:hypothetical protein [Alphaproteobacteria bacterium]